jgi:hypothetical protein
MPITPITTGQEPIASILRDVMAFLPQAPEWEVEHRAKQVISDFCKRSLVWQQQSNTLLTTVAGQASYSAGLDSTVDLVRVMSAWMGDDEIDVTVPGEQEDEGPAKRDATWTVGNDRNSFILSPLPESSGVIVTGTVALAPSRDATHIPAIVWAEWRDEIGCGIKAHMMMHVNKPWSNPGQAQAHMREFEDGIAWASNSTGPVRRKPLRVKAI